MSGVDKDRCCLCSSKDLAGQKVTFIDGSWAHERCYEDLQDYNQDMALEAADWPENRADGEE